MKKNIPGENGQFYATLNTQIAFLPQIVRLYSFCQPQKNDRLGQPTWSCFNGMKGAQTQDPKILNQPPRPLSQPPVFHNWKYDENY